MQSDLFSTLSRPDLPTAFALISALPRLSSSDFSELLSRGYFSSAV